MELRSLFEWLFNVLVGNVISTYFVKIVITLFPSLERFFVSGRAWVSGSDVLYAGDYQDVRNPDHIVSLRRGGKFPAGASGNDTSWRMTSWDAGEAEKAAKGCREELLIALFLLLLGILFYRWFLWLSSMMPAGPP